MSSFKDLIVWEKSMDLVVETYKLIDFFPAAEKFALSEQLRRCSISIPSNIAEGAGRKSKKEFVQFLHISLGSLYELQTQIDIASRLHYITKEDIPYSSFLEIEKMINSLITSLKR